MVDPEKLALQTLLRSHRKAAECPQESAALERVGYSDFEI
jgi:hypothetical protein